MKLHMVIKLPGMLTACICSHTCKEDKGQEPPMDFNNYQNNGPGGQPSNNGGYYYNQGNVPPKNNFANASLILGICSLVLLCTGIFSIPLGALGILFAVLSRRAGKMNPGAKTGCILSLAGLLSGLFITLFAYFSFIFTTIYDYMEKNPDNYDSNAIMDELLENLYGTDYKNFLENTYGIDYESLMDMLD